ncbi:hypothetical protein [Lysobacter sp. A3-1-A15]|uniref:hypothetical protein n=1 Tax=Novilysobacter viscosus TaxID=3098602 RepID=UPI00398392E4
MIYLVGIPLAAFAIAPDAVVHMVSEPRDSLRLPAWGMPRVAERDDPGQRNEHVDRNGAGPATNGAKESLPPVPAEAGPSRATVGVAPSPPAGPDAEPDPLQRVYERQQGLKLVECDGSRPSLPGGFARYASIVCSNAGDLLTGGAQTKWVYASSITMYTHTIALLFAAVDGDPDPAEARFTTAVADTLDPAAVRALLDDGTPAGHTLRPEILAMIGPDTQRLRMQSDDGRWQSILLLAGPEPSAQAYCSCAHRAACWTSRSC